MITEKTLFILGAGASCPYGYPTGIELRTDICKHFLQRYTAVVNAENENSINWPKGILLAKAGNFAQVFKNADPIFVDQFLSANPSTFGDIGKMAIATSIYHFEKGSRFGEALEKEERKQDWYALLFRTMVEGFSSPDDYTKFSGNQVAFITFNYDRSLEHYLYRSLTGLFYQELIDRNRLVQTTTDIIMPFPFVHIYGQIAKPNWLHGHKYGGDLSYPSLNSLKDNIKVVGEERQDIGLQKTIRTLFTWAKRIFFLGFGYADENLSALGWPIEQWKGKKFYGTAMNVKDPKDMNRLRNKLTTRITGLNRFDEVSPKPFIILEPVDCYSLLDKCLR